MEENKIKKSEIRKVMKFSENSLGFTTSKKTNEHLDIERGDYIIMTHNEDGSIKIRKVDIEKQINDEKQIEKE